MARRWKKGQRRKKPIWRLTVGNDVWTLSTIYDEEWHLEKNSDPHGFRDVLQDEILPITVPVAEAQRLADQVIADDYTMQWFNALHWYADMLGHGDPIWEAWESGLQNAGDTIADDRSIEWHVLALATFEGIIDEQGLSVPTDLLNLYQKIRELDDYGY